MSEPAQRVAACEAKNKTLWLMRQPQGVRTLQGKYTVPGCLGKRDIASPRLQFGLGRDETLWIQESTESAARKMPVIDGQQLTFKW